MILVDYTAKVKDTNEVFETTKESDAKSNSIYDANIKYQPKLISVGESWVLKGLDDGLMDTKVGDKLTVEVLPEKGFGLRDKGKVRMIPLRKLGDDAEKVSVGDTIEIDQRKGIIRFMGSGRVQVDFNHRYAGKTILYDVNVLKSLETDEEKTMGILKRHLPIEDSKIQFKINGNFIDISVPEELFRADGLQVMKHFITTDLFKFVTSLEKVNFVETYTNQKVVKKETQSKDSDSVKKTVEQNAV